MKPLSLYASFMSPFWQLKANRNLRKKIKVKAADEIVKKIEEFRAEQLSCERLEKKSEGIVFGHYMDALNWVINGH